MNNIDVIGVYQIGSSAHVPEILNLPSDYGLRAGVCVVAKETQVLYSYGDNGSIGTAAWMRSFYLKSEVRCWTDWVRISTATPPEEYDLPLAEGWTHQNVQDVNSYCKTQEGVVIVNFSAKYSGAENPTDGYTIGFLPAGFRPNLAIVSVCTQENNGGVGSLPFWVLDNGGITIYSRNGAPIGASGTAVFVAAN